jgi:hypothetical protein
MIKSVLLAAVLMPASAVLAAAPRFAIYLAAPEMECPRNPDGRYERILSLAWVPLSTQPWITEGAIEAFDAKTDTVTVRKGSNIRYPSPSVHGSVFVAVTSGERAFAGVFWTPYSSFCCCPLPHIEIEPSSGTPEEAHELVANLESTGCQISQKSGSNSVSLHIPSNVRGAPHNNRVNAAHSVVTPLAHGGKRRAAGRARYAVRYADKTK